MSSSRPALPAGTVLDCYRLSRQIGSGGFSLIYLAEDEDTFDQVAIKEYFPKRFGTRGPGQAVRPMGSEYRTHFDRGRRLFFQEVKTLATLRHPSIVQVSNCFLTNETAYSVLTYEPGTSLARFIQNRGGNLSLRFMMTVFPSLLDALELIHGHRHLHLDIKPSNVRLRPGGRPLQGPVRVHELDPGRVPPESLHEHVAPAAEGGDHPEHLFFHFRIAVGRHRGPLGRMVRAGGGVRLQRRDRGYHRRGGEHAPDAPAGHRIRLARAGDDDDPLQQLVRKIKERRGWPGAVVDSAVDLVRDDPDVVLPGPFRDRPDFSERIHRASRIAGRAEDQPTDELVGVTLEVTQSDLEAPLDVTRHHDRFRPRQVHDLRVGHPGRRRDEHLVIRAEESEADVEQFLLGAGPHHDPLRIDRAPPAQPGKVPGDRPAELGNANVRRVLGLPFLDGPDASIHHRRRRGEVRLADTARQVREERVGGSHIHTRNGAVDDEAASEDEAFDKARRFLSYLPSSVHDLAERKENKDDPGRAEPWLIEAVPRDPRKVYDMRRIIAALADRGSYFEIGRNFGRSVIGGLARLGGHPVLLMASDPYHYGGAWNAETCQKVVRFVDLAETFHLPVVYLEDCPGFLIGLEAEKTATRGAGSSVSGRSWSRCRSACAGTPGRCHAGGRTRRAESRSRIRCLAA